MPIGTRYTDKRRGALFRPYHPGVAIARASPRLSPRERAQQLLESRLSAEQRTELAQHGYFHVVGSRGRRYRIRAQGVNGNVEWVDNDGVVLGRLCAHPSGSLPHADYWLAQMLALQHDEDAFLRVANVHAGRRPPAAAA